MAAPLKPLQVGDFGTVNSRLVKEWIAAKKADSEIDSYLLTFIDLRSTFGLICCMVTVYVNWLQKLNWQGTTWARMRLTNMWRCVPFYDTDAWVEHVRKFGLPVSHRGAVEMPLKGQRPLQLALSDEGGLGTLLSLVGLAFGVPIGSLWAWVDEHGRAANGAA
jgi:hypothetical protein